MATVLLLRHGRTTANATGELAGRLPVELDETGRGQAQRVGERLRKLPLAAVVSSPLIRCRQTLELALPDIVPETDEGLIECGYGDWTGKSLKELSKEKLWKTVQQQPSAVRFPGGEAMTEMAARAVGAVRSWDDKVSAEHGEDADQAGRVPIGVARGHHGRGQLLPEPFGLLQGSSFDPHYRASAVMVALW